MKTTASRSSSSSHDHNATPQRTGWFRRHRTSLTVLTLFLSTLTILSFFSDASLSFGAVPQADRLHLELADGGLWTVHGFLPSAWYQAPPTGGSLSAEFHWRAQWPGTEFWPVIDWRGIRHYAFIPVWLIDALALAAVLILGLHRRVHRLLIQRIFRPLHHYRHHPAHQRPPLSLP